MKALIKYAAGDGNVDVFDVAEPTVGENLVKVEVGFCGVCGTDIHVLHDTFRNYPPVILGHEFAGSVVEVGANVTSVAVGEKVAGLGATAVTCGKCEYCLSGNFIFCSNRRGMGHGVNGGFARYVVMRPDQLYRLPEELSLEEAALSEPFAAAIQAVTEVTKVRIGDVALVSGPGPMGLLCLKLLVAEGVKTIVAGTQGDEVRLEAACRFGASAVIQVGEQNLLDAVRQVTDTRGVDVAFECAGVSNLANGVRGFYYPACMTADAPKRQAASSRTSSLGPGNVCSPSLPADRDPIGGTTMRHGQNSHLRHFGDCLDRSCERFTEGSLF